MFRPGLLTSGTNFSGAANEKAKKLFKATKQVETLGELTDYSVLDQYSLTISGDSPPPMITNWELFSPLSSRRSWKPGSRSQPPRRRLQSRACCIAAT
jgi:hypothetical protein